MLYYCDNSFAYMDILPVLFLILLVCTLDQNIFECWEHSGHGKLLQIWIKTLIKCGPITWKLVSLSLAANVCINNQVLGPQYII
jgi:hypothetical protein